MELGYEEHDGDGYNLFDSLDGDGEQGDASGSDSMLEVGLQVQHQHQHEAKHQLSHEHKHKHKGALFHGGIRYVSSAVDG